MNVEKVPPRTLPHLFETSVARFASNVLMWEKREGAFRSETYAAIRERVHRCAAGQLSIGIQPGDRVALLSEGRRDWVTAELGVLYTGAICVPLSVKLEEVGELRFRLEHSGCRMLIVSGAQFQKALQVARLLPKLQLVTLDQVAGENVVPFEGLLSAGDLYLEKFPDCVDRSLERVAESDPATISYTSGTIADPKGIVLTHRNYTANVEQCSRALDILASYRSLLILPWDHSFTHTAGIYLIIVSGAAMGAVETGRTYAETLRNIPANIRELRPSFLFSVPALARNFRKSIENGIRQKGPVAERVFRQALKIAYIYHGNGFRTAAHRKILKPFVALFDRILFRKIREGFGGELAFFIGGGALLDIELQRFFYAIGLPMFQGYGLTEAAPVISANVPAVHKLGSSGRPVPDLAVRICDEDGKPVPAGQIGEIVVKGENVMTGYWKNERATREAIPDGWLRTGDLGRIDEDGFLYVLGRVKSLLISSDAEKFSPEGIEEALTSQSPYIEQLLLYNTQSPYTAALLFPNAPALRDWLAGQGLSADDGSCAARVLGLLESEINEYRDGGRHHGIFPTKWLPSTFAVLTEGFTEQNQLLNATLKMVRGRIVERHKHLLDFVFTVEGKRVDNVRNREAIRQLLER